MEFTMGKMEGKKLNNLFIKVNLTCWPLEKSFVVNVHKIDLSLILTKKEG